MKAEPMGLVGNIEDPHIIYDEPAGKWRMIACEHISGFKAVLLESDQWNAHYKRIAGPSIHDATGTAIQWINSTLYCFSSSDERREGKEWVGTLRSGWAR